ncbi:uncharacterized protein [Chanodichthys erythropterus]|uniref:uncharacterized protein n=1 Tax=Chanodichthys erythropterus TaxID=933992 RepID=UPI00351DC832
MDVELCPTVTWQLKYPVQCVVNCDGRDGQVVFDSESFPNPFHFIGQPNLPYSLSHRHQQLTSSYVEEFVELAYLTDWSDAHLIALFLDGLDEDTIRFSEPDYYVSLADAINLVLYLKCSQLFIQEVPDVKCSSRPVLPKTRAAWPVCRAPSSSSYPSSELPACPMLDPHSSAGSRRRRRRKRPAPVSPEPAPVSPEPAPTLSEPVAPSLCEPPDDAAWLIDFWTEPVSPAAAAAEPSAPAAPAAAEPAPIMNCVIELSNPKTVFPPCLLLPPPPTNVHTAPPPQATSPRTPPRPVGPDAPPWLQPPSSLPLPISPPVPPGSILPPVPHQSFIGLPSHQDCTPRFSPRPFVPHAPLASSLSPASLWSAVALAPLRPSGAPPAPRSAEPAASPCPAGSSPPPGLVCNSAPAPDPPWQPSAPDPPWPPSAPDPPWLLSPPWRPPLQSALPPAPLPYSLSHRHQQLTSSYVEEFVELAYLTDWSDAHLIALFLDGLDEDTIRFSEPDYYVSLADAINLVLYLKCSQLFIQEVPDVKCSSRPVLPKTRAAWPVCRAPSSSSYPSSELPACPMLDPHSSAGSRRRRRRKRPAPVSPEPAPVSPEPAPTLSEPVAPSLCEPPDDAAWLIDFWTEPVSPAAAAAEPSAPAAPAAAEPAPIMNCVIELSNPKTVFPPCLLLPPPPTNVHTAPPPQATSPRTPPRPVGPDAPPWLQPPSSLPLPISPPVPPGSILPPVPHQSFIGLPSHQDCTPRFSPRPFVPHAPLASSLSPASLWSAVALAPLRPSGAPPAPRSAEPAASPCPAGSSPPPGLVCNSASAPDPPWQPSAPDPPWQPSAPDPPWPPSAPDPPWLLSPPWRPPLQSALPPAPA